MPLPKIPGLRRIVIEPSNVEKHYDDAFMSELIIRSSSPNDPWFASVGLRAFNYDAGDISNQIDFFNISDLRVEAQRSPVVAQALGYVIYAVSLLVSESIALKKKEDINQQIIEAETSISNAMDNVTTATDQLNAANAIPDDQPPQGPLSKQEIVALAQSSLDDANMVLQNARNLKDQLLVNLAEAESELSNIHTEMGMAS